MSVLRLLADARTAGRVARTWGATVAPSVQFKGDLGNLWLGQDVDIQHGTQVHLGGMDWCEGKGRVEIHDGTAVSPSCTIWGAGPGGVYIGARCSIGPGVRIVASRNDYKGGGHLFGTVYLGDDVIVYSNAVIGHHVTIGNGAVIGAGMVVTRGVPAGTVVR